MGLRLSLEGLPALGFPGFRVQRLGVPVARQQKKVDVGKPFTQSIFMGLTYWTGPVLYVV